MEIEVSFNSNPSITKDLQFETGDGLYHSLSFYSENLKYNTAVNENYIFVDCAKKIDNKDTTTFFRRAMKDVDYEQEYLSLGITIRDIYKDKFVMVGSDRNKNALHRLESHAWGRKVYGVTIYDFIEYLDIDTKGVQNIDKEIFIYDENYRKGIMLLKGNTMAGVDNKGVKIDDVNLYAGQYIKGVAMDDSSIYTGMSTKQGYYLEELFAGIPDKGAFTDKQYFLKMPIKETRYQDVMFLELPIKDIVMTDSIFVGNTTLGLEIDKYNESLSRPILDTVYTDYLFFGSGNKTLDYDSDNILLSKRADSVNILGRSVFIDKLNLGINILANLLIDSVPKGVNTEDTFFETDLAPKDTIGYIKNIFLEKSNYKVYCDESYKMFKSSNRQINIINSDIGFIIKSKDIFKDISYRFFTKQGSDIFIKDTVFGIDKAPKQMFENNTDVLLSKEWKDSRYFSKEVIENQFSKVAHDTMIEYTYGEKNFTKVAHDTKLEYSKDYVWLTKGMTDTRLEYAYTWIDKIAKDTSLHYEYTWIDKMPHGIRFEDSLNIGKGPRAIRVDEESLFMFKFPKSIYVNNEYVAVGKAGRPIRFNEYIVNVKKEGKAISDIEYMFGISKDGISTYLDISNISAAIDGYSTQVNNLYKSVARDTYEMANFERNLFGYKDAGEVYVDSNISTVRDAAGIQTNNDLISLGRGKKDTHMDYENHFMTVIHYDGGWKPEMVDSGIIDELILPHKDYNYNKYLGKLIDEDGNINLTYVTSYDSVTEEYTVSIPLENPISMYSDVGRDYIDLDVRILEILIYLIRVTWKDNLYKYIAMSAQDSLIHVFKNVDKLLADNYTLNYHQRLEMDRAIQLFRWYSEMAILNNCSYILTFDTTSSKVNVMEKSLGDLTDMIQLDNMHISNGYVLEPIDNALPASITFINLKKDYDTKPKLAFTLYNVNSSSSISIIDGVNVTTKSLDEGMHEISEDIRDKVVIDFAPIDITSTIAIANVLISNIRTPSFTLRYKGKFGEINKVMQDLLDQMLVVGAVSQDLKDRLADLSPVTAAVAQIEKYFEYHHQDKLKGKRLITKK